MESRRFQVFVSSTFLDLQEERAAVVSALLQLEAFPAGMELFPAADDDAWTLIKRVIDSSDYYLLVIGGKYGSVDPETEVSYTEKEFDYAVDQRKPVLAFLHTDPDTIAFGKSEKDVSAREKLNIFRKKVEAKKHVKYWSGPEDLSGKVALSFADFRQRYPAIGWIRGDAETSAESLNELNELRKQVSELEKERAIAGSGPPPDTERLSQGTDLVGFSPSFQVDVRRNGEESWQSITVIGRIVAKISWDDLFSCVGPDLLDEADERVLSNRISRWLTQMFAERAGQGARRVIENEDREVISMKRTRLELDSEDFGTLIVQLRALGLIEKSERARSVKDRKTYWKITPYGDERLTALRAIERSDSTPQAEDAE